MLDRVRHSVLGRAVRGALPSWLKRPLAELLERFDARRDPFRSLLDDVDRRLLEAGRRETEAWRRVDSLDDWKRYIEPRIEALRASLGDIGRSTGPVEVLRSRRVDAAGIVVENLAFQSRSNALVGANLYRPDERSSASPAILLCHSHHGPKTEAELLEAGIEWARAGWVVLVPDLVGHGERRDHPFHTSRDWHRRFRVDRQDYWFRYVLGIQLRLVGHSLMGWMVRDAIRCVDVLTEREDVDPERIVIVGSVAGGGDVAAITAALDPRIGGAVPFGFGGAWHHGGNGARRTDYEPTFAGTGSWEETRNLRLSAKLGFLPWAIVASIAPRYLVFAHEFGWEEGSDPVWPRIRRVYGLHDSHDRLAVIHGRGTVSGPPPHNTHCKNVGSLHRQLLAPRLEQWFGATIPLIGKSVPLSPGELACLEPDVRSRFDGQPVYRIARKIAGDGIAEARLARARLSPAETRAQLLQGLSARLGNSERRRSVETRLWRRRWNGPGKAFVEQLVLGSPPEAIQLRLYVPVVDTNVTLPLVIGVRQSGFDHLDRGRRGWIGRLLARDIAVCLIATRGMGRVRQDETGYGRVSLATRVSVSEWMLGRSLLATKLSDLRTAHGYLATRGDLDAARIAVWGDSGIPADLTGEDGTRPMNAEPSPTIASPLGALLALLAALYEESICAVCMRGGLSAFSSMLESPFCLVPHEAIIPGMLGIGDLSDVAAALSPRPLRMEGLVDARNRIVDLTTLEAIYRPTIDAYRADGASENLLLSDHEAKEEIAVDWLEQALVGEHEGRHPR